MTHTPANMVMDINGIDSFRERNNSPRKASFRSSSVLSKALSIPYFEKIEIKNDLPSKDIVQPINSSQLSYNDNNSEGKSISRVTELGPKETQQYVQSEVLALKNILVT